MKTVFEEIVLVIFVIAVYVARRHLVEARS
jgi:hypothetical protein